MTSAEYHGMLDNLLLTILRVGIHRLPKELRGRTVECMNARMRLYDRAAEGDPTRKRYSHASDISVNDLFDKTKH